ncbi:MAG: RecX family transcriptional regulator [Patescibacteria group bacterium]
MHDNLKKALNRCYFYLKYRPRTEKEIYQYLYKRSKKYKLKQQDVFEIIDELKNKGYLNDSKFIEWFVDKRIRSKPKAVFIIKSELRALGINEELIRNYFEENKIDEFQLAFKALEKAEKRFSKIELTTRKEKEILFLTRKGFKYDTALAAVEELNKKD